MSVNRKIGSRLPAAAARPVLHPQVVRDYGVWIQSAVTAATVVRASEICELWQISFWDATILAAAEQAAPNSC